MPTESPVVLIHGAFQTAATWDLVAPLLKGAGRHVILAALTGLENDGSDLAETVALDTHIRDVVDLLEREQLSGVTLVAHSYAGMITGVAEHVRDRIAHLVYVDAFIPEHDQSAMGILPEATRMAFRRLAEDGGGWRMPAREFLLDLWGLEDGSARSFVQSRLADFTIRCFLQPLNAPTLAAHTLRRSYIASVKPGYPAEGRLRPVRSTCPTRGLVVPRATDGPRCASGDAGSAQRHLVQNYRGVARLTALINEPDELSLWASHTSFHERRDRAAGADSRAIRHLAGGFGADMNGLSPDLLHVSSDGTGGVDCAPRFEQHLTPQEIRLLGLLAKGHSCELCAGELRVSINTVRNYVRSVYEKLDVHSKAAAVTKALRSRIIV